LIQGWGVQIDVTRLNFNGQKVAMRGAGVRLGVGNFRSFPPNGHDPQYVPAKTITLEMGGGFVNRCSSSGDPRMIRSNAF
jgi:hypothetical protein